MPSTGINMSNIMVLGTSSGVGKTLVTLALCRWLSKHGRRVAPFKPMSMSAGYSSHCVASGGEIHVHQAHQAVAAGVEPQVDMNPIMLKKQSDELEILVHGLPSAELDEIPIMRRFMPLRTKITESFLRLSEAFDCVVMEGCGSPVELNVKDRDISNFWAAETFNARCVLVTCAENTGVFASILGTLSLLVENERSRVGAFIINKFHGDPAGFAEGIRILEERTGICCAGVIPYFPGLRFIGRDSESTSPEQTTLTRALDEEIELWTDHVLRHLNTQLLESLFYPTGSSGRQ
jgi:adenosylcobyric acid synthase